MVFLFFEFKSNWFEDRIDMIGLNWFCCFIFFSFLYLEVIFFIGYCLLGDFLFLRFLKEVYYYCNCRK